MAQSIAQVGASARARRPIMILTISLLVINVLRAGSASEINPSLIKDNISNKTNIDRRLLHRISNIIEANKTLTQRDVELLNRTALKLGINNDVINQLSYIINGKFNKNESKVFARDDNSVKAEDYNTYKDSDDDQHNIGPIEESPAYASSVVLASDLLSLTRAVANVKDKVCREQGYKFLDGLLINKRSALRSKYMILLIK